MSIRIRGLRACAVAGAALALGIACGGASSSSAPRSAPTTTIASPRASVAAVEASASSAPSAELPPAASESVEPIASAEPGPAASASPPAGPVCNPQKAFGFLIRKSYIPVSVKKQAHEKALRFRATTYGSVKGFGDPAWNATLAKSQVVSTTVFGLPVSVHKKIVPALACAEAEIKASCGGSPYAPGVLAGIRDHNTYRGGEVTNHMFGIAIDLDPLLNSCCGCTKKWQASPLCQKKAKTIWERMSMPKCWVDAFEKYGFYWLGHDKLQDTMHFEFLADPAKILTRDPEAPASAVASTSPAKPTVILAQAGVAAVDDDPYADDLPPVAPPEQPEPKKATPGTSESKPAKKGGTKAKPAAKPKGSGSKNGSKKKG